MDKWYQIPLGCWLTLSTPSCFAIAMVNKKAKDIFSIQQEKESKKG